jgi:hypothetical protein
MNQIFGEEDHNFKLTTFRKITFLINKVLSGLSFDFAFTDDKGYNRNLNPACSEVIFHDVDSGTIYLKIGLQNLEIDSLQELSKYEDLIKRIIYDKLDYQQILREIKLIDLLD